MLALAALLAFVPEADTFGRFGYAPCPDLPDLRVDENEIRAKADGAEGLRFASPLRSWKPVATSPYGQTVGFGINPLGPTKMRATLTAPGVALYFPQGMRFKVGSVGAPYLTWPGGSVSAGVPTPAVRWAVVSFVERRVPYLIAFPGEGASLKVSGRPGDWTLETSPQFRGWVRVGLPVGNREVQANSAAPLGELAAEGEKAASLFTQMPPEVVKQEVHADDTSVTATWRFSAPGALVPPAVRLAALGGYALRNSSPVRPMGPLGEAVEGTELTLRFPARRVPPGRAVALGLLGQDGPATVSPQDAGSTAELALALAGAGAEGAASATAQAASAEFMGTLQLSPEPATGQALPYDASGEGLERIAAHALLLQTTAAGREGNPTNALLTSLIWRLDWATFRFTRVDEGIARRAGALVALTGLWSDSPEIRLAGAMAEAGLAAERGEDISRRRRGEIPSEPLRPDPFWPLRRALYAYRGEIPRDYAAALLSPLRLYGEASLGGELREGKYLLAFDATDARPSGFTLAGAKALTPLLNLSTLGATPRGPLLDVRYAPETTGRVEAWVEAPGLTLPPAAPAPRYDPTPIPPPIR